jgi:4-aminobutyrate aminotransferase / (S)-3-amino-2-methylpropionate transaminase / 5-aminovalerate transaminase
MGSDLGQRLPEMRGVVPGDAGQRWVDLLARTESPALTARRARRAEQAGAAHDPIVWARAEGANVVDTDGNVLVDLTAGFGAAAVGHGHPQVVAAVREQAPRLMHALGDVHPSDLKVRLLERLASIAPWSEARVILGMSGSDAVEAALKSAVLYTGRPGVLAFEGGYHGLAYGPLAACGYKTSFRAPFAAQLNPHVAFAPWPEPTQDAAQALDAVAQTWAATDSEIGAVLIEPVQGRGGVRVPPAGFLAGLAELARERGALVIADEVLTGLGRCGARWRCEADGMVPDLLCTGKALGGGMPVSACLGRPEVMAAWGDPSGEAIHTGTFFGHPLACAAALAVLEIVSEEALDARAREGEALLRDALAPLVERHPQVRAARVAGMLAGVVLEDAQAALGAVQALLQRGWVVLPCGVEGNVVQLSPPLNIAPSLLEHFAHALDAVLSEQGRP